MSLIEEIVSEVRSLPADKQEQAYKYVHGLHKEAIEERSVVLKKAFAVLSLEEVEEWERNIKSCRKIDAESW